MSVIAPSLVFRLGGRDGRGSRSVARIGHVRGHEDVVIGRSGVRRIDGAPKVTGAFSFASDLWADGMLWGHTVRSPHPHARIRSVDVSKALATSGVHAVLVADDVPGRRSQAG